jgi:hypothetical protein
MIEEIRVRGVSNLHPVGTCRMGREVDAVVDPRLRVHGIEGLAVADASVMPLCPNSATHAPTMMLAEKAADLCTCNQAIRSERHDDNQDGSKKCISPLRRAAKEFGQQREDGSAQQWAQHGLSPTKQNVKNDHDAEGDRKILRLDVAEVVAVKTAADSRDD